MKANNNINAIPWDSILKVLKNEADTDENNRLAMWIEENNQNRRLWNELNQTWNDIREFDSGFNPDASLAWQKIIQKTKIQYQKPAQIVPIFWKVAAACVLLLIGVGIGSLVKSSGDVKETYTQYETQYGKSFVTLPDGTKVWLNEGTKLAFSSRFNEKERRVKVRGEAFFDVTHDPDIPFLVDAKNMQVKVYGTKFDIQDYDSQSQSNVALLEGSVSLTVTGYPCIRLKPGYTATYNQADKKLTLNPSDTLVALWANAELRVEGKSLAETALLLENWYHIRIEVAPALKNSHYYTFTLRHESVSELLAAMQKIGKFKYKINEQRIIIY